MDQNATVTTSVGFSLGEALCYYKAWEPLAKNLYQKVTQRYVTKQDPESQHANVPIKHIW